MSNHVLELKSVSKSFPGVKALSEVGFYLEKDDIISLVGENGAGKSTLINIITGQFLPDEGEVLLNGERVVFNSPTDAIEKKIGLVPQELNLIPHLSVAENIFLGDKKKNNFWIDWKEMNEKAEEVLSVLDIKLDVKSIVGGMSVANQQLVQIARAVSQGANILIFDEPTACLTLKETQRLLSLIKQFKKDGKSIIFVSHHMDEVVELSDRVVVMRDGCLVEVLGKEDISIKRMISGMVGRDIEQNISFRKAVDNEEVILKVDNISKNNEFSNISFEVKKGEVFGVAGLIGAKRTELVSAIFGERSIDSGEVYFEGEKINFKNPKYAINKGFGYVPEERRNFGILPTMSIRENLTIANISKFFKGTKIDRKKEDEVVKEYTDKVRVKMASPEGLLTQLSGGNQQKVILARWLSMGCKMLILDEPTRGIDVLAKEEIYRLIRECSDAGMTMLVVSSEMEELIRICNRILIMHEGKQKGIENAENTSPETILNIALE